MRSWLRQWHQARISKLAAQTSAADLKHSAIVFSPHQDDETLGCGGTVMRKKRAGAEIKIAFLADGSGSHSHLMAPDEMSALRQKEAIAAAQKLGLNETDVIFLGLRDGTLADQQQLAIEKITELLQRYQPEEVYVPYYLDPHPDHMATNTAVMGALQNYDKPIMVWEYPVWFWHSWPWVSLSGESQGNLETFKQIVRNNLKLAKDFNHSIYIGDLVDLKRDALEQHESQVKKILPVADWFTLGDVSNGDFLKCFFQDHEIFYCHRLPKPNYP